MNKYTAFQHHLQNLNKDSWKADFSEIETILGSSLPKSAHPKCGMLVDGNPKGER
jgi:hypothetical protein